MSLNSLDLAGVRWLVLVTHRFYQKNAGAEDTSADGATELKWEFDEALGHYYVSFLDDQ